MLEKMSYWLKIALIIPIFVVFIATLSFTILNYPAANATTIVKYRPIDDTDIARVISSNVIQSNLNRDRAAELLDSTVRIRRDSSAGSGVILGSAKHPSKDVYYTYIITNHHNVTTADEVTVEIFNYLQRREIASITSYTGRVVKRSFSPDLALVEVKSEQPFGRVASFITMAAIDRLALYDPVFVCGCSLGRPPIITNGNLARVTKEAYTITAFAIFGNSGGGLFDIDGNLLGIVTQIAGVAVPAGEDSSITVPVSNMPYVIPSTIAASWLANSDYSFLVHEGTFEEFIQMQDEKLSHMFYRK